MSDSKSLAEPTMSTDSIFSTSLEFQIPSGCWYIADLSKVYVQEYDRADYQVEMGVGCNSHCLDALVSGTECAVCTALENELNEEALAELSNGKGDED